MRNIFIVALLIHAVWAAPSPSQCYGECPDGDASLLNSFSRRDYSYEASVVTNVPDVSGSKATAHFNGQITLQSFEQPCHMTMSIGYLKAEHSENIRENLQIFQPIGFTYTNGSIDHVGIRDDDDPWATNVKKSILSHFIHEGITWKTASGEMFQVMENDVIGSCPTNYSVHNSWGYKIITKQKDLSKCKNRNGNKSLFRIGDLASNIGEISRSLPVMEESQICTSKYNRKELVEVTCTEVHKVRTLSMANKQDVSIIITTKIKNKEPEFPSVEVRPTFRNIQSLSLDYSNFRIRKMQYTVQKAAEMLRETCEKFEEGNVEDFPGFFEKFIDVIKSCTVSDLLKIESEAQMQKCSGRKLHLMFMNAVLSANTESSIAYLSDIVAGKRGDPSDVPSHWITSLAFIPNPTFRMIKSVEPFIARPSVTASQLLPVAALAHTACINSEQDCRQNRDIDDLNKIIQRHLNPAQSLRDAETEDKMMMALKAFGNLGYLTHDSVQKVMHYIQDPHASVYIKKAAIDSFRRVPCDDEVVRTTLKETLKDQNVDPAVRIFAYLISMRCPCRETIRQAFEVLNSDGSNQVASFIYSHLKNWEESTETSKAEVSELIKEMRQGNQFTKPLHTDYLKFSNNFNRHVDLYDETALEMEGNVIFSPKSYIPAFVNTNMTINLFGQALNFLEIGGSIQGYDKFIDHLFGPGSFYSDVKSQMTDFDKAKNILADVIRVVRHASQKTKDDFKNEVERFPQNVKDVYTHTPTLDLYARVMGHELTWIPMKEMSNFAIHNPQDLLAYYLDSFLEAITLQTFEFVNSQLSVPTYLGYPLNLNLKGAGYVEMGFRNMVTRKQDMNINNRPGFALKVEAEMVVDAYNFKTGVKTISTASAALGIKQKTDIDTMKFKSMLTLPDDPQDLFKVKSKTYLVGMHQKQGELLEVIPKPNQMRIKQSCLPHLDKPLGLKLCYIEKTTKGKSMNRFPLVDPFEYTVQLEKSDRSIQHYAVEMMLTANKGHGFKFVFDPVGSSINRKVHMEARIELDRDLDVSAHFTTQGHNYQFEGHTVNSDDLKEVKGKVVVGNKIYSGTARAQVVRTSVNTDIAPYLEVFDGINTHRLLEGKISISQSKVEFDMTSMVADIKTKGRALMKSGSEYKLEDLSFRRGPTEFSGDGLVRLEPDAVDLDAALRYNNGDDQTLNVKGFFKHPGSKFEGQLDVYNSMLPDINTRLKLNGLSDYKEAFFKTVKYDLDVWYGPNFSQEKENHLSLSQEVKLSMGTSIDLNLGYKVDLEPFHFTTDSYLDFQYSDLAKAFTFQTLIKDERYYMNLEFKDDPKPGMQGLFLGKIIYPGQQIHLQNNIIESEMGKYDTNGFLELDPGNKFELKGSVHMPTKSNSEGYHMSYTLKDKDNTFRVNTDNIFSSDKIKSTSTLNIHQDKFLDYDFRWQESDAHVGEVKMHVKFQDGTTIDLNGDYSATHHDYSYSVNMPEEKAHIQGNTKIMLEKESQQYNTDFKLVEDSETILGLTGTFKKDPENNHFKIKLFDDEDNCEIDLNVSPDPRGEHRMKVEFLLDSNDKYYLETSSDFRSVNKKMTIHAATQDLTLLDISLSTNVKQWDCDHHKYDMDLLFTTDGTLLGDVKLEGSLNNKPTPTGMTANAKLTLSGSDITGGDFTFEQETADMNIKNKLSGQYGSSSLLYSSLLKMNPDGSEINLDKKLQIKIPQTPFEDVKGHFHLDLLFSEGKLNIDSAVQSSPKNIMKIEINFDASNYEKMKANFKLNTPYKGFKNHAAVMERKFDENTGEITITVEYTFSKKKSPVGLILRYNPDREQSDVEVILKTPFNDFEKLGFTLDLKKKPQRYTYNTLLHVYLPYNDVAIIRNNFQLKQGDKFEFINDFKCDLFNEAFLEIYASLKDHSNEKQNVNFKAKYRGTNYLTIDGNILPTGQGNMRGDLSVKLLDSLKVNKASLRFDMDNSKPEKVVKTIFEVDDAEVLETLLKYVPQQSKFKAFGSITVKENKLNLDEMSAVIDFKVQSGLCNSKITIYGKKKKEFLVVEFNSDVKPKSAMYELKSCLEKVCLNSLFRQLSGNDMHSHELKLERSTVGGEPNLSGQYKLSRRGTELKHSIIMTENQGTTNNLGYEVLIQPEYFRLNLLGPNRVVELSNKIRHKNQGMSDNYDVETIFLVDKTNKPANKLVINSELRQATDTSRQTQVYHFSTVISHPKFKDKTINLSGDVKATTGREILGVDLDVNMFDDDTSKFDVKYLLSRHPLDEYGTSNNYTMMTSISNKFMKIETNGHLTERYSVPYNTGVSVTYGNKNTKPKFLLFHVLSDFQISNGYFGFLLQNNDNTLELKNAYEVKNDESYYVRSFISGYDETPGFGTDFIIHPSKASNGQTVYGVNFTSGYLAKSKNIVHGSFGMQTPQTLSLLISEEPKEKPAFHTYVTLTTPELLHLGYFWEDHFKTINENVKNEMSSLAEKSYSLVKTMADNHVNEILPMTKKIRLGHKNIKQMAKAYERNFKEIIDGLKTMKTLPTWMFDISWDDIDKTFDEIFDTEQTYEYLKLIPELLKEGAEVARLSAALPYEILEVVIKTTNDVNESLRDTEFFREYHEKINQFLEFIWHNLVGFMSESPDQSWYDIFKTKKDPISLEELEQKVEKVMEGVMEMIKDSDNFLVDLYRSQMRRLYRLVEQNFLHLARLLKSGFGRFLIDERNEKTTRLKYEVPLPKAMDDLMEFPEALESWIDSESNKFQITLEDQFEIFKHAMRSPNSNPPSEAVAIIEASGLIRMFDGEEFTYPLNCEYLLAQDFAANKFALFGDFRPSGLDFKLYSGEDIVDLDASQFKMKVNGKDVDSHPAFTFRKSPQMMKFYSPDSGVEIICLPGESGYSRCQLTFSGYYQGKLRGILGTNDLEHFNDMMESSGKISDDVATFLDNWKAGHNCRHQRVPSTYIEETDTPSVKCKRAFKTQESKLAPCFKYVNPNPYYKECMRTGSVVASSKIYSKVCKLDSFMYKAY